MLALYNVATPCLLDYYGSIVTQAQLDKLREHFHIPNAILMRALGRDALPKDGHEDLDEISPTSCVRVWGEAFVGAIREEAVEQAPVALALGLAPLWENSLAHVLKPDS